MIHRTQEEVLEFFGLSKDKCIITVSEFTEDGIVYSKRFSNKVKTVYEAVGILEIVKAELIKNAQIS